MVKVDTKYCAKTVADEYLLDQHSLLVSAREAYNSLDFTAQVPFNRVSEVCNHVISTGGKNLLVTRRDRESLDRMLVAHDFNLLFSEIVAADDEFAKKPSPESFSYFIN